MRILVLNAGSATLKAAVLDPAARRPLATATIDRPVGRPSASGEEADEGVEDALRALAEAGVDGGSIEAVGHRVVHGGTRFQAPVLVDDGTLRAIEELAELAPLHNEVAARAIRAARRALPGIPHVAAFDTAFHATLPPAAYRYPVPDAWYREWGIRRFGFHGLSVAWAVRRAGELLGRSGGELLGWPAGERVGASAGEVLGLSAGERVGPPAASRVTPAGEVDSPTVDRAPSTGDRWRSAGRLRLVVAHLGSGCSVTAVDGGRSVDTSMGMTPLEGLMMGTRSGSIDPGIVLRLLRGNRTSAAELEDALDRRSGLLGVSGRSADVRELLAAEAAGDEAARLALALFVRRAAAGIAAAATALSGLDGVVFTGGIGEHSGPIRARIVARLGVLGVPAVGERSVEHDAVLAEVEGGPAVLRIQAREDLVIAEAVRSLLGGSG